jgi:hypothetical protein
MWSRLKTTYDVPAHESRELVNMPQWLADTGEFKEVCGRYKVQSTRDRNPTPHEASKIARRLATIEAIASIQKAGLSYTEIGPREVPYSFQPMSHFMSPPSVITQMKQPPPSCTLCSCRFPNCGCEQFRDTTSILMIDVYLQPKDYDALYKTQKPIFMVVNNLSTGKHPVYGVEVGRKNAYFELKTDSGDKTYVDPDPYYYLKKFPDWFHRSKRIGCYDLIQLGPGGTKFVDNYANPRVGFKNSVIPKAFSDKILDKHPVESIASISRARVLYARAIDDTWSDFFRLNLRKQR